MGQKSKTFDNQYLELTENII